MNYFKGKNIQVEITGNSTRIGEKYEIILKIGSEYGFVDDAKVLMNQQKSTKEKLIKMEYVSTENEMNIFKCSIDFENVGVHYFCFKLIINQIEQWIKNDVKHRCVTMSSGNLPYWSITVYENDFCVPDWAKGKIMYQIFPDRFFQSKKYMPSKISNRVTKKWGDMPNWALGDDGKIHNNDYFMGNLKGIEEKLDYIENLGVEIIYLNPIFLSQSNHRYDTADYEIVDSYLGTNEDLVSLCNKVHKRGMKIIIDGVFNHTGNDSKYFNEYNTYSTVGASQGPQSPYFNWYRKNDKGEFQYWWGFKNLPVCDGNDSGWQNFIYGKNGVIDKWFAMGIDGIRLDVADELTDEFIENVRIAVKRNKKDGFILGEVWDNAICKEGYGKQRKYLLGKGLDSVMNYPFTNAILKYVRFGRTDYFTETINDIISQYPEDALYSLMNSLSTHDITRAMTTLVGDGINNSKYNWVWDVPYSRDWQFKNLEFSDEQYKKARNMMKIATIIQYFLPGNPCIYYGDEIGMYGYKDPFNRRCFEWDNIDIELHDFFVKLGQIRKKMEFLSKARLNIIEINKNYLAFERNDINESALIIVNRSENEIDVEIPEKYKNGEVMFKSNFEESKLQKYGFLVILSK